MFTKEITPYSEVNKVINSLAEGVQGILGDNLVGMYLFGSLSYGDFNLDRSDIDLSSIMRTPVTLNNIEQLKSLHQNVENAFPSWAKRIEASYTPQTMLDSIMPPQEPRPYFGESIFYPEASYGNEWIINLYLLYNHGITVIGPDFKTLIPPVSIREVQEACVRDLYKEWEPKLKDPDWLDNSHYQSYLVLNLCRILNTVIKATVLSKRKSAFWVKQQFPQWSPLIGLAESWRYGKEMNQKKQTLEFLKFVIEKVAA